MSIVVLASGGLDSTLVTALAMEDSLPVHPLFVDYGQRAAGREWIACRTVYRRMGFPRPTRIDLRSFGTHVPSGLTDRRLDVVRDAFLPGRNLLLLLSAAAFGASRGANRIAIGLLSEVDHLFSDQTDEFLRSAGQVLRLATARDVEIVAPLRKFQKRDVIQLAASKGIRGTYSCHAGGARPCRKCISCNEFVTGDSAPMEV